MANKFTIITGYFGAPVAKAAEDAAASGNLAILDLDKEIERRDGRKISRICMMMGEHEYRNKEFEILEEIQQDPSAFCEGKDGLVVLCGDGVLHDEMSRNIALKNDLIIVGGDSNSEDLWYNALHCGDTYHAFMHFGSEEEKKDAFDKLYIRQKEFFESINQEV